MENVRMFGNGDYKLEVSLSKTTIISSTGERPGADEISFLINDGEKLLMANKEAITIDLSKHEAIELAIHLLKISVDDVSEHGDFINNYQDYAITVHRPIDADEVAVNEPIICIDNIEPEDIDSDGCMSICISNESAKKLIGSLAKIV